MKKLLLFIFLLTGGFLIANAQTDDYLVTFETEEDTASWQVFANGADPAEDDVTVVDNPDQTGINPSEMALRFVVNADADPWAGMVNNLDFTGDNSIAITEENYMFTMMVYKTKISNVGLKLEQETGGGNNVEILVPNTLVNEWEMLTFDFSDYIGTTYEALVLFPDFPETRTEGTIVYMDNIMLGGETTSADLLEEPSLKVFPNPAQEKLFIEHQGMTGFTISNMLGQTEVQRNFDVTNQKTIEVGHLSTGIHFISVQSDQGTVTQRFLKR